MDDPSLDPSEHSAALKGLARLNWLSRSSEILWNPIQNLSRQMSGRPLRILDIASGSGDLLWALHQRASKAGISLVLHGTDVSDTAINVARQYGKLARHVPHALELGEVTFTKLNALREPLPHGFDIVMSSLFFHHLTADDVVLLLRKMSAATERLILVNDLRRSAIGLCLAHVAGRLTTRSRVVHIDGPRSVKAAFKTHEMQALMTQAGLTGYQVTPKWPYRFLCEWQKAPDGQ